MTITEFLLARIIEDEVSATLRECHREDCGWIPDTSGYSYPCHCGVPERMASECAAKRAILNLCDGDDMHGPRENCDDCTTIYILATVYADHPDYQSGWSL